jgi:hypothetical protein
LFQICDQTESKNTLPSLQKPNQTFILSSGETWITAIAIFENITDEGIFLYESEECNAVFLVISSDVITNTNESEWMWVGIISLECVAVITTCWMAFHFSVGIWRVLTHIQKEKIQMAIEKHEIGNSPL